ncbi:SIR2 family protein [Paenarthrobacter aurescens]|uniref:SIR2 family protein n=1 Tax=Paenarthrobacter aurescens TaxID=43663 RepID=UPI0021BE237C|nr:SIR2 family protein [Paenarthrobacter aurescens]MCT9868716.1 SIR2 family protein [Paenarthrobacter aurescens]
MDSSRENSTVMSTKLTESELAALRLAARSSRYHLLLGAGVSFGTTSADGRGLPGGQQLAEELADVFGVHLEDGDLLWRIYDRAVVKHGNDAVYRWLRSRFSDAIPPAWMKQYARFPWEKVWTLNIDDAFESSYNSIKTEASRPLESCSWDGVVTDSKSLKVIHLHGHVHDIRARDLVFSLTEYYESTISRATWPLVFRDQYGVNPFVVVGARLRDEPDLEAILRRRPEHDAPSFYVSPDISPGLEEDLRSWRLIPVRATAEDFLDVWAELTGMNLQEAPTSPEEYALRLSRQFRELKIDSPGKVPVSHDYLGGDDPRWSDVVQGVPALMDWSRTGCNQVGKFLSTNSSSIMIYVGDRLSGRSTGLLQIAFAFRRAHWRVFLFTADELPDQEAILQYASDGKAVLLVFDGVADFAKDVAEIISASKSAKMSVSCLAVDLTENTDKIIGHIPGSLLSGGIIRTISRRLTVNDASSLVARLQEAARLGQLEPLSKEKGGKQRQISYFRNQEIFSQMAGLEQAPGFGRRVGEAVRALTSETDVEIAFFCSMAFRLARRISVVDVGRMTATRPEEILRRLHGSTSLGALFTADGHQIGSRQRWLALEPLINHLGSKKALAVLAQGITRLRPRISQKSNRERNAPDTLVGSMMSYKYLSAIFPDQALDNWYGSLESTFGDWSGRFWEQRAIANREAGWKDPAASARAESFARRAVSITNDTYSNTTLGTVLLARAAQNIANDLVAGQKYYEDAFSAFNEAAISDPNNVVTWMAYLRYSLRVLDAIASRTDDAVPPVRDKIESDWTKVHLDLVLIASTSEDTKSRLDRLLTTFRTLSQGQSIEAISEKPLIFGRPVVGARLKAKALTPSPDHEQSFQWKRNGDRIDEATSDEYVVRESDIGSRLTVTVAVRKSGYGATYSTSAVLPLVTSQ